jgi:hypothetical protein
VGPKKKFAEPSAGEGIDQRKRSELQSEPVAMFIYHA